MFLDRSEAGRRRAKRLVTFNNKHPAATEPDAGRSIVQAILGVP